MSSQQDKVSAGMALLALSLSLQYVTLFRNMLKSPKRVVREGRLIHHA